MKISEMLKRVTDERVEQIKYDASIKQESLFELDNPAELEKTPKKAVEK